MDIWRVIELTEILGIVWYLLTTRDDHADTSTQLHLMVIAMLLAFDVFVLKRQRPDVFRDSFDIYSFVVCYEKLFKKYWIVARRKLGSL